MSEDRPVHKELKTETSIVEAILFLETEPVDIDSLVRISRLSKDVVAEAVDNLRTLYKSPEHGLEIIEIGGGIQLVPKTELWEHLKERYGKKNDHRLSKAALETLSIVAYSQPITRSEIENIRGVSADGMLRLLTERELIKVMGKKDVPGKPVLYGTTKAFLEQFRLSSIADLPKLDEASREKFELDG